jgi:hypothetical protein
MGENIGRRAKQALKEAILLTKETTKALWGPETKTCLHKDCHNLNTTFPYFCNEHNQLNTGLRVGTDNLGLYAAQKIMAQDTIDVWNGEFMQEPRKNLTTDYLLQVQHGVWIDATKTPSCMARWVRDPGIANEQNNYNAIFKYFQKNEKNVGRAVLLIATRDIEPGEEITANMGIYVTKTQDNHEHKTKEEKEEKGEKEKKGENGENDEKGEKDQTNQMKP